ARLAYSSGRHASIARPIIDGSLPDGSRVNLTFSSEVTKKGSTFTIRKFRADPLTITDLISFGTISAEAAAYLWYLVEHKASILIVGGVATGKTTFLNCTAMFIRPEFKIVSIEDTPELNFPHENWIQAVSRTGFGVATGAAEVSLFDLLKASLRQRPDFIIVGEIRGEEAYTLFQAVATGHGGLTTLHADSVFSAISRLENEPLNIPRPLIPNITALVLLNRVSLKEGPARRIINCTELSGIDESSGRLLFDNTFRWDVGKDVILPMGPSPYIKKLAGLLGLNEKDVKADLERRKVILEWMVKSNIRRYSEVSQVIREYYADHEKLYLKAVVGV
ncbi:MAG: type II/IV secretion system ATPase subunit, partial [Candidatus Bathyarchaeia archaeon]